MGQTRSYLAELASLLYAANLQSKGAGGRRSADPAILCMTVLEALGPFDGFRGEMHGTDLFIVE